MREPSPGSFLAEFEKSPELCGQILGWQADIVNEYRREDQFEPIIWILSGVDIHGIQPYVKTICMRPSAR